MTLLRQGLRAYYIYIDSRGTKLLYIQVHMYVLLVLESQIIFHFAL